MHALLAETGKSWLSIPTIFFFFFPSGSQAFIPVCLWKQLCFICLPVWFENYSFSESYLLLNIYAVFLKMELLMQEGPPSKAYF